MQIASLADIIIPENRQRQHFTQESINDLAESIKSKGLLHPIVCERTSNGPLLVAGERRLRALTLLSEWRQSYSHDGTVIAPGKVPYTTVDLPAIEKREAELEENLIREDLTWEEQTRALAELHELRLTSGQSKSARDTAEALKTESKSSESYRMDLRRAQVVAPYLDDPDIKRAKSLYEAEKIVMRKAEDEFSAILAERNKSEVLASPHTLIEGDLRIELEKLPDGKFSCIIADPPYGMRADSFGDAAKLAHQYEDDRQTAIQLSSVIITEGYRAAKRNACLFMFCDIEFFDELKNYVALDGWKPFRTPLIWSKGPSGHAPWNLRGFRRQYEIILYAVKGDPALASLHSDIFEVPNVREKTYAAQKPVELYEQIIRLSCAPSESVLDPCCGAGTIFAAAKRANVIATGVELDSEAINQCKRIIFGADDEPSGTDLSNW